MRPGKGFDRNFTALGLRTVRLAAAVALLVPVAALPSPQALAAPEILEVESDKGVRAWLVNEPSIPVISVQIAFRGGSITDPTGKEGLANMVAGLLDEGAGDLDSAAFQERLQELAIGFSARANKDTFRLSVRTLVEHRDEAFRMLGMALSTPRYDPRPVERIRQQLRVVLARDAEDPDRIASHTWFARAFPDHPVRTAEPRDTREHHRDHPGRSRGFQPQPVCPGQRRHRGGGRRHAERAAAIVGYRLWRSHGNGEAGRGDRKPCRRPQDRSRSFASRFHKAW